jgi:hypothetical protein
MPSNAMCCGHWITLREDGAGFDHDFDCKAFFKDTDPAWASVRRSVCQQLFEAGKLCPEIAPFCEPFKEDMERERARKRDEAERRAAGTWPPKDRSEDDAWDMLHTALDGLGLIPGLGIFPDAINAGIYVIEGDWFNAGISMVGMVEGIGQGATATRLGIKVSRKAVVELGEEGLARAVRQAVTRAEKEKVLRAGYHRLSSQVDSYARLSKETRAWNKGMRELYPGHGNPDLRLDAHHVFEGRIFNELKDEFAAKGITRAEDLPCVAIPYEGHIRSPEALGAVFEDFIARNLDEGGPLVERIEGVPRMTDEAMRSLTEDLKKAIKVDEIHSVPQAIEKYEAFYQETAWWDKFKPVFDDLRARFDMPPR